MFILLTLIERSYDPPSAVTGKKEKPSLLTKLMSFNSFTTVMESSSRPSSDPLKHRHVQTDSLSSLKILDEPVRRVVSSSSIYTVRDTDDDDENTACESTPWYLPGTPRPCTKKSLLFSVPRVVLLPVSWVKFKKIISRGAPRNVFLLPLSS